MDYRNWAPKDLARIHARDSKRANAPVLTRNRTQLSGRLLTDERMRSAWKTLENHPKRPASNSKFLYWVYVFSRGPFLFQRLSAQEMTRAAEKVIAASEDILRGLETLGLNYSVWDLWGDRDYVEGESLWSDLDEALSELDADSPAVQKCREALDRVESYHYPMAYQRLTRLLWVLQKELKQAKDSERILPRPYHKSARLHYFVRRLTQYAWRVYGAPLRGVVASTATVVFDLADPLTKDHVTRIAPFWYCEKTNGFVVFGVVGPRMEDEETGNTPL